LTRAEETFLKGLSCSATLTELCALAVYTQTVELLGNQYIRSTGENGRPLNHLEMGPLAQVLLDYCEIMASNGRILLERDPTTPDGLPATFNGKPWPNPRVFDAVEALAPTLPHLECAIERAFAGAHEKWLTFLSEYLPGGRIFLLSPAQRSQYFVPATSDHVEGAGGEYKQARSQAPRISQRQFNGRHMWKHDPHAREYMRARWQRQQWKSVRARARELSNSGEDKKRRAVLLQEQIKAAEERLRRLKATAAKAKARLEKEQQQFQQDGGVDLVHSDSAFWMTERTVPQVKLQLKWHRTCAVERGERVPSFADIESKGKLAGKKPKESLVAALVTYITAAKAAPGTVPMASPGALLFQKACGDASGSKAGEESQAEEDGEDGADSPDWIDDSV
jgi:hypothetical protein